MAKNSILDYDTTPDNNTDMGGIGIQGTSAVNNFDNAFRTLMSQIADWTGASTIASGTTTDLSTVNGTYVTVTGTSTITSFGTAKAGWIKVLRFSGVATITHNATSMILPSGLNITTAAGDTASFVSLGSGNWACLSYYNTPLGALKSLSPAADRLPYFNGASSAALTVFTSLARSLLDDTTGAAMFATMGATISAGNPGFTKLPNGLLIQFGSTVVTTSGEIANVPFPSVFNSLITVLPTNGDTLQPNYDRAFGVHGSSTASFVVRVAGFNGTTRVNWIAIGT